MLKKVFDYIKEHPLSSHHDVAKALKIQELMSLACITELSEGGFLKLTPIPLSAENNCSAYYSAVKKTYFNHSPFCTCKFSHWQMSDTESDPNGYWDTCVLCGKHIEDGFHYYNHYDGEDHDDIDY